MARRKLESTEEMKRIMAAHYHEIKEAEGRQDARIAWCTSVGPAELLRSMGFLVYFPENHSAMLGASHKSTDLIPYANALGFSPEICSYVNSDIGAFQNGYTALDRSYGMKKIPRPDVLVYNTNQCRDVQDWFSYYSREFDAPLLGIQTHRGVDEVNRSHIDSITQQIEALVEPLEKIADTKLEMAKLSKTVALARECSDLWESVLKTAIRTPAPITFFDGLIQMGPAVVLRGTESPINYYRMLLEELEGRISDGIGAVDDENLRLYWDGMPIWGRLRAHSELFSSLKTAIVASTYCNSWIFSSFDRAKPFESMARAYLELFIVRSESFKEDYIKKMVKIYDIYGIIFHEARTCHHNTNTLYGMPQRLASDGIPTLTINGDFNDMRCLSDEQAITNIEAFAEQLEEYK